MCKTAVCPECDGDKKDYAVPSPMVGGGNYYPDCQLCDGKGFVVVEQQ
jgi:hypothetical protein